MSGTQKIEKHVGVLESMQVAEELQDQLLKATASLAALAIGSFEAIHTTENGKGLSTEAPAAESKN